MLPLFLPSPMYLACKQFGAERGIFFSSFPHVVLCYGRALVEGCKMQGHCPWLGTLGTLAAGSWRELWGSIAWPLLPALPKADSFSSSQSQGTILDRSGQPTFCLFSSKILPWWEGRGQILLWLLTTSITESHAKRTFEPSVTLLTGIKVTILPGRQLVS